MIALAVALAFQDSINYGQEVQGRLTDPAGRVTGYSGPISPGSRVHGRQLDIDDTDGPGTETYTMTAEVYGDYQVRVNYYRGDAPQVVLVRWVVHEGTPREQSGQRTVSLAREDHNRDEGGANESFAIPVPAP